ncbi:MAG: Fis family transcriptional regulator, partial [Deltaproteobacteria bacterium]|nr:Fis family transcriptional regulator [Deltaproteobacteria bacterium]
LQLADWNVVNPKITKQLSVRKSLSDVQRQHIRQVLQDVNWKIEGQKGAAAILDLKPSTLRDRMNKLGIKRP